ncbi:MAG: hypothetical protein ACFCVD_12195 [Nodosilinea sp.]
MGPIPLEVIISHYFHYFNDEQHQSVADDYLLDDWPRVLALIKP